jgi:hypothetical protein
VRGWWILVAVLAAAPRPARAYPSGPEGPQSLLRFFVDSMSGVDCDRWGVKAQYLDAETVAAAEKELRGSIRSLDGQQRALQTQIKGMRHAAGPAVYEEIGHKTAELWTVRAYRTLAFVTLDGALADRELAGRESPGERVARKTRFCRRMQSLGSQIKDEEAALTAI